MKLLPLAVVALGWGSLAHATSPKLTSITPPGGQQGTDLEVRFSGQRLEDAQEIIFYSRGLEVVKMEAINTNRVKAQIRIAADCRLGEHQARIRTASGVSDLRTFHVGPFPTVEEKEPNNEPAQAQRILPNSTVNGSIAQEDVDCFQVGMKKGQRLSVEIEAMHLGRAAFDPFVSILDPDGVVLASSDDSSLLQQDSLISVNAPKDGTYVIQVRETSYGGNADYLYRLHVGNFPRPTMVYPAGGKAGETLSVRFLGDAAGEFTQEVKLPSVSQDRFGVFARQNDLTSPSPNWMRVSDFPNILESPPNQAREYATPTYLAPPLALNGILAKDGEADWFRFPGKKDQALDIHVYARRLRSPLDSVLNVYDAKGKSLASNDDAAGADSQLKFTPSEDGEYFIRIQDQLGKGGPDYVYRIEVTPVTPGLSFSIPQIARYDSQTRQWIVVPRGNRFATLVSAKRANFSGDLGFSAADLPAGVTLHADLMAAKVDAMPLVFEASATAPITGRFVDLTAKLLDPARNVRGSFVHNVELVQGPNNSVYYGTRADKLYVAVTAEAPFKLRIVEPKVPLVQFGQMDLPIVAERKPGFDEAINLKMLWNPPGIGSLPDVTMPKGSNAVVYPLNANGNAEIRKWKIAVLGSAPVSGGTVWISSQLASLDIGAPFVTAQIVTTQAEPGQTANVVCKLEHKVSFDGKATIKLLGLPEMAVAPEKHFSNDDKEVVFPVKLDPSMSPRSHRALFCSVVIKRGAETVTQSVGAGGVLRVVPPKKAPVGPAASAKVTAKAEGKSK